MTGGGPVATQDHAFVLGCKGIGELLACRTNVNVLISHIAEVLLAEASFRLCVRGHRLWQRNRDASLLACQDLFAVEVTAVGDGIELLYAQRRLGLVGHMGELRSVGSVVGYLMHDDQMMVGLDGNLDVVADDAGTAAAGRHRTGIGIVSEICWSGVASICTLLWDL